jgi:hypothetical protein
VADGWLERSGQAWKMRTAVFGAIAGMTLLLFALFAGRMVDRRFADWVAFCALIALSLLVLNLVLPLLVRCRVCGVQMETSSNARTLSRDRRLRWMESLQVCPVCGDDGLACAASRERWLTSGQGGERPYWSLARILWTTVAAALLIGGGVWIGGRYRVR